MNGLHKDTKEILTYIAKHPEMKHSDVARHFTYRTKKTWKLVVNKNGEKEMIIKDGDTEYERTISRQHISYIYNTYYDKYAEKYGFYKLEEKYWKNKANKDNVVSPKNKRTKNK